ncbi:hypothetical protein VCHA29O37_990002 [Vibrio chagasii]|nr:hypothetical protein VCHA29O37_990002 [Vibrio chagasii]
MNKYDAIAEREKQLYKRGVKVWKLKTLMGHVNDLENLIQFS